MNDVCDIRGTDAGNLGAGARGDKFVVDEEAGGEGNVAAVGSLELGLESHAVYESRAEDEVKRLKNCTV